MSMKYPNMTRLRAIIHLDLVDSAGGVVVAMDEVVSHPMAVSLAKELVWYGFVLNDEVVNSISPGCSACCDISFLNDAEARNTFAPGASFLFGDGLVTKGVMRVISSS